MTREGVACRRDPAQKDALDEKVTRLLLENFDLLNEVRKQAQIARQSADQRRARQAASAHSRRARLRG